MSPTNAKDNSMTPSRPQSLCELCNGTGYFKSNTAEYEGNCPNCSKAKDLLAKIGETK